MKRVISPIVISVLGSAIGWRCGVRMRAVEDALFIEVDIERSPAGKAESSLICLGLDGEPRWVEGTQTQGGIDPARAASAFLSPRELAASYALDALPSTPWEPRLPDSELVSTLRRRPAARIRWQRSGSWWLALVAIGPDSQPWQRQSLTQIDVDGRRVHYLEFDAPMIDDRPLLLRTLAAMSEGQLYGLWEDGRFDRFGSTRVDLGYAVSVTPVESFASGALLVHRSAKRRPEGYPERPAGVELFLPVDG
ncbi:hypothetical protein G6O69_25205 [Pseudenhygromyxa sp. WMMC2535]|uniref:hypothetical protein n=1 Tax=Pseudenhygromyxa sp. WMMC2535 TaxID=2712867 RepID=UPI0015963B22|nr:hypothetical protein [Pseudenhygromyxa sp. WMMC2535]NVB41163.1 hypothetical protein [Pseudenhygromyxa sp. WMMC2535]